MKKHATLLVFTILSIMFYSCKNSYTCDCSYTTYEAIPTIKDIIKIDTVTSSQGKDSLVYDTVKVPSYDTIKFPHNTSFSLNGVYNSKAANSGCYIDEPKMISADCSLN